MDNPNNNTTAPQTEPDQNKTDNFATAIQKRDQKISIQMEKIETESVEENAREEAVKKGLHYINLLVVPIDSSALYSIPEDEARQAQTIIIQKKGRQVQMVTANPDNLYAQEIIDTYKKEGYDIKLFLSSSQGLEKAWRVYEKKTESKSSGLGILEIKEEDVSQIQKEIGSIGDIQQRIKNLSTSKIAEILVAGALQLESSDIHFEPEEDKIRLRYRIDGVLGDIATFDKKDYPSILSRIKIMSGLKLNLHSQAQDGRFTIRQEATDIEVRVSVLPGSYGENIVMRLLDPRTIKTELEELGMREDMLEIIRIELQRNTGAIITTGPTGAGKTTTLYSFVRRVNQPGIKIITIEDPVEYHIEGISQTQVEPEKGYTFANGLRAIVRQDPDVILVGEIRDKETADIAMQAALTGHLVFTTLHTNDAAGTIPRLIDLGVDPNAIAPAINAAMAQRLVRRLCKKCSTRIKPSAEEYQKILKIVTKIKEKTAKIKFPEVTEDLEINQANQCERCNFTGYKGRIGIYELFLIDDAMERLIMKSPAILEVRELAETKGMITMAEDGILKVLQGITTLDEVFRVAEE